MTNGLVEIASAEEFALFNQAFLARVLHSTAKAYSDTSQTALPVVLSFLVVPLTLHKLTREALPSNRRAQMHTWIQENPRAVADLDRRVIAMKPFVGASIRFGLLHRVLRSSGDRLSAGDLQRRPRGSAELELLEVPACLASAAFLGRWFAQQDDLATLLALWGLRP